MPSIERAPTASLLDDPAGMSGMLVLPIGCLALAEELGAILLLAGGLGTGCRIQCPAK